jgi:hypothetical protein
MGFDPSDPVQRSFHEYGPAAFPDPRDAELDAFLNGLRPAGGVNAVFDLRAVISPAARSVFLAYASRAAVRAVREQSSELLVMATVALVIGGLDNNDPDALTKVPQVEDASRRVGVHIADVFGPAMELVGPPGAVYLAQWLSREPEDRTLACMGYVAVEDDTGLRYVPLESKRGDEARIVQAFCAWLEGEGWQVEREVAFVDVVATRDGVRLYAEAKGRTTSPGLDVDTMYGQLLRRMPADDLESHHFAVVVPDVALPAALRVPQRVRTLLGIKVFAVDANNQVAEVTD